MAPRTWARRVGGCRPARPLPRSSSSGAGSRRSSCCSRSATRGRSRPHHPRRGAAGLRVAAGAGRGGAQPPWRASPPAERDRRRPGRDARPGGRRLRRPRGAPGRPTPRGPAALRQPRARPRRPDGRRRSRASSRSAARSSRRSCGRCARRSPAGACASVAFVAPSRAGWLVPLYDAALLATKTGHTVRVSLITREVRPLEAFGTEASATVAAALEAAGVEFIAGRTARVSEGDVLVARRLDLGRPHRRAAAGARAAHRRDPGGRRVRAHPGRPVRPRERA